MSSQLSRLDEYRQIEVDISNSTPSIPGHNDYQGEDDLKFKYFYLDGRVTSKGFNKIFES